MQVYLIIMLVTVVIAFLAVRLYRFLASGDGLFNKERALPQTRSQSYRRKRDGSTPSKVHSSRGKHRNRTMTMVTRRSALVTGSVQKPWGW